MRLGAGSESVTILFDRSSRSIEIVGKISITTTALENPAPV